MTTENNNFSGWARVEVMGHQSHIGLVNTEAYGGAVLFRIDQPEIPECEEVLAESTWIGNTTFPAGTVVKRGKIEAVSVLVGAASIYRIIPCTEELARKAIVDSQRRPLIAVKLPGAKALAAVDPNLNLEMDATTDTDDDLCSACGKPPDFCRCPL